MRIAFLLQNAYGIGGTIRATFNAANALAARHDVEIVTVWRTQDEPRLPLSRKVRLTPLIDKREGVKGSDAGHELIGKPTSLVPPVEANGASFDQLTDERVAEYLRTTDAEAVVATRPGLVMYLAEFGIPGRYLRIGQEHRIYGTHEPRIRAAQDAAIPKLDAHTTVSEADAVTHRERFPHATTRIMCIPNASPAAPVEPSDGNAKLVVAAGRLIPVKRYDLLVDAFRQVVDERPDWKLRIYGRGPERAKLRAQIDRLGLSDHVFLMGPYSPIEPEWAKGSIAAVTSREESFGMTIVESMQCGTPVVATDCPHGPGEIIDHGKDGLLVPVGDVDAIAKGLLTLIDDDRLRHAMGAAAQVNVQRYAPQSIAKLYEQLVAELRGEEEVAATPTVQRVRPAAPRTPLTRRLRRTAGRIVRPLRRRMHGTPAPQKHGAQPSATATALAAVARPLRAKPLRPKATCRVDAAGDLVVLLNRSGMSGENLLLTATLRGDDPRQIAVPIQRPENDKGPWTARISRREHRLVEGRWDFHVVRRDDNARRRVASEIVEQRGLVDLAPLPDAPFAWWIPYTTVKNCLSIRTWLRPAHAEARSLSLDGGSVTVEGTLHGARFTAADLPVVAAVPRVAANPAFDTDVTVVDETTFRFTVPYTGTLAAVREENAVWDLSLRLAPGTRPIRIGRLTGDIVERNKTDVYPFADVPSTDGASGEPRLARVRPYFTVTNDLAVSSGPVPEQSA
ncbi:glycosyltransferase family 4 protein [Streptomyces sp. SAJ15]|uniref:glycosyltransferase family 4 protein n=1 Tax=Streptomyces sp. SAJ15 TaxID=2011095 RepID=UPI001184A6F9|nr:glycosyltransferase family 4 protein [Streptomyces sp. SAJ15]TVL93659.1 glycosyl transferase family 1 [Streptomyces sp. SAJ15]